jgi:hypothetical protein
LFVVHGSTRISVGLISLVLLASVVILPGCRVVNLPNGNTVVGVDAHTMGDVGAGVGTVAAGALLGPQIADKLSRINDAIDALNSKPDDPIVPPVVAETLDKLGDAVAVLSKPREVEVPTKSDGSTDWSRLIAEAVGLVAVGVAATARGERKGWNEGLAEHGVKVPGVVVP